MVLTKLILPLLATALLGEGRERSPRQTGSDDLIFITLEEHWLSPALSNNTNAGGFDAALEDFGPLRLSAMNENGVRRQVVSHAPGSQQLDDIPLVMEANNELAANVANNTARFSALAVLPMSFPEAAATELERCIKELGMVGALIDTHLPNGTWYDGSEYFPFWAKAQELDVPIYLHPTNPTFTSPFEPATPPDFSEGVANTLGTTAWNWHQAAGLHFLRLYVGGVFAEFPNLKVIFGHDGECIPFMLARADMELSHLNTSRPSLIETYNQNVWITTSGFFTLPPVMALLATTNVSRIMYSIDYPFGNSTQGEIFMETLKTSGLVTEEEWNGIAFGNAQALLGVQ